MYIVVNKDLKMSSEKVAVQVGHAVGDFIYNNFIYNNNIISEFQLYHFWQEGNHKKVILGATQKELEDLELKGYLAIRDNGHTEIDPNSLTCINLGIWKESARPKWLRDMKTL